MATNVTLADVFTRARRALNDDAVAGGRVFTDALLLEHAKSAYDWFVLSLSEFVKVDFRKRVEDLTYTANEATLSDLGGWPTDLWLPEIIWFRKTTGERYVPLERVDDLPVFQAGQNPNRLSVWSFKNREIKTVPATEAGLLLLDYLAIPAALTGAASPLLVDYSVTAMAYFTAADAAGAHGRDADAVRLMGHKETQMQKGKGADGFMEKVTRIHVKNEQYVNRRGLPEHGGGGQGHGAVHSE